MSRGLAHFLHPVSSGRPAGGLITLIISEKMIFWEEKNYGFMG